MIGGVTTLHAYFAKTDYSLTHKIGSIIILISPLIALLIQYLGLKLKNKLFTEIQVAWSSLFKPIN